MALFPYIVDKRSARCLTKGPTGVASKGKLEFAQLFFDVTAKNAAQRCSTFLLPHFGQVTPPFSYSASVRILANSFWQPRQK
jgi:hypothetical protein